MKKIPYGKIDFKRLIEENCYYIDKTMYLEKLENVQDTLFYLRPGRFGKSLFTSMMNYYYDINSKDLFNKLFDGLYIHEHPTNEKNSYYILKFDFSGIDSAEKEKEALEKEFKSCVINGINVFLDRYNFTYEIVKDDSIPIILKSFLTFFKGLKLENKIYILIDEYDNFTNAILEGNAERFKNIVGNEGFIKAFYASIKEYIGLGVVARFFATGICPITLDSMTTGFNIATNISNYEEFNSMIGLTHKEVDNLLNEVVEEKNKREEIKQIMIENYDGYLFNEEAKEKVFNATLVMYLLDFYKNYKSIPKKLIDTNIVVNYGKIENILKLQNNNFYEDILDELLKTSEINGTLKYSFNLLGSLNKDDLISLLYYFGYLTIKEYNEVLNKLKFKVPNKIMKETYNNYFIDILEKLKIEFTDGKLEDSYEEILFESKINKISLYVSEILKLSDNRIFMKFDEKYIALVYYTLLRHPAINTYLEYPCKNGYIDIMLFKNNNLMKNNIMIELKYIKKKDYSEELLNETIKEGKTQLESYSKDERLGNPMKYLVVFVGNELKLLSSIDY